MASTMAEKVHTFVQRRGALRALPPRRELVLPIERVQPVIRIAHRLTHMGTLVIPHRIIFDHEMILVLRGQGELVLDTQTIALRPLRLLVIEPFVRHRLEGDPRKPFEHIAVHFDLAAGFPAPSDVLRRRHSYAVRLTHGLSLPTCTDLPEGHPIIRWLGQLVEVRQRSAPTAALEASVLLARVLVELLKREPTAPGADVVDQRNRVRLQRVIDHVQSHLQQRLSARDLAAVAGLSESHLTRLLRRWRGQSPAEYVATARIDAARRLLADVDLSIKQIARRVGFTSTQHFGRVFRRIDGLTPTEHREALLAGRDRAAAAERETDTE